MRIVWSATMASLMLVGCASTGTPTPTPVPSSESTPTTSSASAAPSASVVPTAGPSPEATAAEYRVPPEDASTQVARVVTTGAESKPRVGPPELSSHYRVEAQCRVRFQGGCMAGDVADVGTSRAIHPL